MLIALRGSAQRRKDSRRGPLEQQSLNRGDTSMGSAVPQIAAIGLLLRLASRCKGLSESNSVVARASAWPETINSALFHRDRAKRPIHLLRVAWGRNQGRFARTKPFGQIRGNG
jgi:hypothetical protein